MASVAKSSELRCPVPRLPGRRNGLRQGQHLDRAQERLGRIASPEVEFTADDAFDQGHRALRP